MKTLATILVIVCLWSCSAEKKVRTGGDAIELTGVRVRFLKDTSVKRSMPSPEGYVYVPRLYFLYVDEDRLRYRLSVYMGLSTTIFWH
jgi:hypothetical protein